MNKHCFSRLPNPVLLKERQAVYDEARQLLASWKNSQLVAPDTDEPELLGCDDITECILDGGFEDDTHDEIFSNREKSPTSFKENESIISELFTRCTEEDIPSNRGTSPDDSFQCSRTTLERIRMRQEISAARKLLREEQRAKREKKNCASKICEPDRRLSADQKKRKSTYLSDKRLEEELIQQEMVRFRKELELERQKLTQPRSARINGLSSEEVGSGLGEDPNVIGSDYSVKRTKQPTNSLKVKQSTENDRSDRHSERIEILRIYFSTWKYSIFRLRILVCSSRKNYEHRLLKLVMRKWMAVAVQQKLLRELDVVRNFASEMKKKEEKALYFRSFTLKLRYIQLWRGNAKWSKANREVTERQQLRQAKEEEFLVKLNKMIEIKQSELRKPQPDNPKMNQLRNVASQSILKKPPIHKPGGTPRNSSPNLAEPTEHEPMSSQRSQTSQLGTKLSLPGCSNLMRTVSVQRQRIAAQNREIAMLKLAKRQMESLLESKKTSTTQGSVGYIRSIGGTLSDRSNGPVNERQVASARSRLIDISPRSHNPVSPDCNQSDHEQCSSTGRKPITSNAAPKNKFLLQMEERAKRRAQMKAAREERWRIIEENKKKEYAEQLEEEARRIRQEKQAILEAKDAKRRHEEEKRKRKELWIAEQRKKLIMASLFNNKLVMRYSGFLPWKTFIAEQHKLRNQSEDHRKSYLKRSLLVNWFAAFKERKFYVINVADEFHRLKLLKRCLNCMQLALQAARLSHEQTNAWYEYVLMRRVLTGWCIHITELRMWDWELSDVARYHHHKSLKKNSLQCWRMYPIMMKTERERERRRENLRWKLRDVVPDFSPPKSAWPDV